MGNAAPNDTHAGPDGLSRRTFLRHASATIVTLSGGLLPAVAQAPGTHVYYDPVMLEHAPRAGHPESPQRLDAVMDAVGALESRGRLALASPRPASDAEILRVHSSQYLDQVRREIDGGRRMLSTGDTEVSTGSLAAALGAAGAIVSAVDAVMTGRATNAFCAVRPPGHHASQARGMGFCVFNNIAVGARHALRRHGIERVLIADWDVHHGNGTQAVFWRDGAVLFFDTHQHPWYPGTGDATETGAGEGQGLIVNRPFPAGAGRQEILGVFREELVPRARRFQPQLVLISAGFDSRANDPLGRFTLTDQDFADLTEVAMDIADEHADGRLVSVLEGGYALAGLTRAVDAHLRQLSA